MLLFAKISRFPLFENDIMLLFAKISRFPLFENSGFLVETGSFPDGRGGGEHTSAPPATPPVSLHLWLYYNLYNINMRSLS